MRYSLATLSAEKQDDTIVIPLRFWHSFTIDAVDYPMVWKMQSKPTGHTAKSPIVLLG